MHAAVLEALRLAAVPYALAYTRAKASPDAEEPLPAQYNWYDRYGDVPQWSGVRRATELSIDSSSLSQKTFNIGAVYLMALVQGDGALKLVCYFNDSFYARTTILDALGDVSTGEVSGEVAAAGQARGRRQGAGGRRAGANCPAAAARTPGS